MSGLKMGVALLIILQTAVMLKMLKFPIALM